MNDTAPLAEGSEEMFPRIGSTFTVQRCGYLLSDRRGRTWLAFADPSGSHIGVMQPLSPGDVISSVRVEDDAVVVRVESPSHTSYEMPAFLIPRRLVPAVFAD
ncbi:MAG: hypothetical protein WCG47_07835 [Dermatophilaceae bacterium]